MKGTGKILALAAAVAAVTASAADIFPDGRWSRVNLDDSASAIGSGEGLYLYGGMASATYAGDAMWTLPVGNLLFSGEVEVGVREGTLKLTASEPPDLVSDPPAELQKAALWLDAGKNVETAVYNETNCAVAWYDARETSMSDSGYGHAVAGDTEGEGPLTGIENGRRYVDFIGYNGRSTARAFFYKNADGTAKSYPIRHAFFVQGVVKVNISAPVLGHSVFPFFFTYPDVTHGTKGVLASNGSADPLAYSCEYLRNGAYCCPVATVPAGVRLHEFTLPPNRTIEVDSLYQDRKIASGGHRICELLLFTERLTVIERMRISEYLKQKWSCADDSSLSFFTSAGTEVEMSQGVSPDSVRVTGDGVVMVGSGAAAEASYLYRNAKSGRIARYALKDDTSSLALQASEYECRLSPKDRLTVTDSPVLSTLAKETDGAVGSASVSSARKFVMSTLDPSVTNLAFSGGGDLVLRAPAPAVTKYETGTASAAAFSATELSIPSGNGAFVDITVEIPASGDWELSFKMSNALEGTTSDGSAGAYIMRFKQGDSVLWERIPTFVSTAAYGGADQRRRYLLRGLAAGEYTFSVRGYYQNAIAASLSDLSMTFVPNKADEEVVPVTDGDFESSRLVRAFFATRDNLTDRWTAWKLTNGDLSKNPAVQTIVSSSMGYSGNYDYMFRASQLGRYGDNALVWYHNNSTATSPETVLPAGTYRLRLDAVRWTTGTNLHANVGSAERGERCNSAPVLTAAASVNGGEAVSLGEIGPIEDFDMSTLSFPNVLTVEEGGSVVVSLNQTAAYGAVQLDNLEFVKVNETGDDAALGEELVADGNFTPGLGAWTLDDWTSGFRRVAVIQTPVSDPFGTTRCSDYALRTAQGGRAYQTISFPAGVFRLSWWGRARVNKGTVSYRTPVTFWYAAAGSAVTNEIVTSDESWCTNFIENVAYFKVPTAGDYVFGFNTKEQTGTDALVDCVSVKQVFGEESVPDIPEHAKICVSGGGRLRLDYDGCLSLSKVKVNGTVFSGDISAEKYPEYFIGPGTLFVRPKGLAVTLR